MTATTCALRFKFSRFVVPTCCSRLFCFLLSTVSITNWIDNKSKQKTPKVQGSTPSRSIASARWFLFLDANANCCINNSGDGRRCNFLIALFRRCTSHKVTLFIKNFVCAQVSSTCIQFTELEVTFSTESGLKLNAAFHSGLCFFQHKKLKLKQIRDRTRN